MSRLILLFSTIFWLVTSAVARTNDPDYYEILVFFQVDKIGATELPALIKDDDIYLPVVDVFSYLGIKSSLELKRGVIEGFFISPENQYTIHIQKGIVEYKKGKFQVPLSDLIQTKTNLYLKSEYFGKVFSLHCDFNFRQLSVRLNSKIELPAARQARLESMRNNLSTLEQKFIPDTVIGRGANLFHLGALNWSVNSRQSNTSGRNSWFNFSMGANVAGGDFMAKLNFSEHSPFQGRNLYYLWRFVDNERKVLRQFSAGKIHTGSISSIFTPVLGVQLSNSPTVRKKSFGTYSIRDFTEPGWIVELYVNNTLVDYQQADESGFYILDIPLIYGNSEVSLRFYSQWGEEHSSKRTINIPHSFLPVNELEYTVSSGVVEDGSNSLLMQGKVNYGLARNITVGGGLEYLSSVPSNKGLMPFLNTSVRLDPNILFTGEYVSGVRSQAKLSYLSSARFQLELSQTQYNQSQQFVRFNYHSLSEAEIGMPFRLANISFFSRVSLRKYLLTETHYKSGRFELSGSMSRFSFNMSSTVLDQGTAEPFGFSEIYTSILLPARIILETRSRYDHDKSKVGYLQLGLRRNIAEKGIVNAAYEHNPLNGRSYFRFGLTYNLSVASLSFSANQSGSNVTFFESLSGSISREPETGYTSFDRRRHSGKGGLIILPFLDVNANKVRDESEPRVDGINVQGHGGHITRHLEDTTIVITGLEPYTSYSLKLDGTGLENIAWRIEKPKMNIAIEPNRLRLIEVPISVQGEASGTVLMEEHKLTSGVGGVRIHFYNIYSKLVASSITESDGYFSFLGLPPGLYRAAVDTAQLNKLHISSTPSHRSFVIQENEAGDYISGVNFRLYHEQDINLSDDTAALDNSADSSQTVFGVQLMASQQRVSLDHPAFKGLKDVEVRYKDGIYYYTWGEVYSMEYARILENELRERGFTTAFAVDISHSTASNSPDEDSAEARVMGDHLEDLEFRVQVLASTERIASRHLLFKGPEDVEMYYHNGMYKYTRGRLVSYDDALILKNQLRDIGFEDAFIVPFFKGERMLPFKSESKYQGIVFRVRILSSKRKLPLNHPLLKGLGDLEVHYDDLKYTYTWGEATSYEEAKRLEAELKQKGLTATKILAFYSVR